MAPRPRGRSRKRKVQRGQTRMDAALDAMRSYGFDEKLILTTIRELLDIYCEEGWPFIEEASYKVLLDIILEKVEQEGKEKGDASQGDGRGENNIETSVAGPSSRVPVPTCSNMEAVAIASQVNEALDAALQNDKIPDIALRANMVPDTALLSKEPEPNAHPPIGEGEGSGWQDINLDQDSSKNLKDNLKGTDDKKSEVERLTSNRHSPLQICSPERADTLPSRRRRPYHGWISSDDEVDLVELTAAPEFEKLLLHRDATWRRKRRWDVRPEDM